MRKSLFVRTGTLFQRKKKPGRGDSPQNEERPVEVGETATLVGKKNSEAAGKKGFPVNTLGDKKGEIA